MGGNRMPFPGRTKRGICEGEEDVSDLCEQMRVPETVMNKNEVLGKTKPARVRTESVSETNQSPTTKHYKLSLEGERRCGKKRTD